MVRIIMGIFVLGLGVLGGIAVERIWFEPQRAAMLERLDATVRAYQATVMTIKPGVATSARDFERQQRAPR